MKRRTSLRILPAILTVAVFLAACGIDDKKVKTKETNVPSGLSGTCSSAIQSGSLTVDAVAISDSVAVGECALYDINISAAGDYRVKLMPQADANLYVAGDQDFAQFDSSTLPGGAVDLVAITAASAGAAFYIAVQGINNTGFNIELVSVNGGGGGGAPPSADFITYSLDGGPEITLEETVAANSFGGDPAIIATLNSFDGLIELAAIRGITESIGDFTAEIVIDLGFPNAEGTYTDFADPIWALYLEDLDTATATTSVFAVNREDGTTRITIDSAAAVGSAIEGSFDATLLDLNDFTTVHTLTGAFRVTREVDDFFGGGDGGVPSGLADWGVCENGAVDLGALTVDAAPVNDFVNLGECHLYNFTVGAPGDYQVILTPLDDDVDLGVADNSEFTVGFQWSEFFGLTQEVLTVSAPTVGETFYVAVYGYMASSYGIQVVSVGSGGSSTTFYFETVDNLVCGISPDTVMDIYDINLNLIAQNDDIDFAGGNYFSQINLNLNPGDTVYVVIWDFWGFEGDYSMRVGASGFSGVSTANSIDCGFDAWEPLDDDYLTASSLVLDTWATRYLELFGWDWFMFTAP